MTSEPEPQQPSEDELRQHVRRMVEAGVSDENIRQFIKDYSKPKRPTMQGEVPRGMGADITRSALHGMSFGVLDKPIAKIEAFTTGLPKWLGGEGRGGTYDERYRAQLEAGRGAQKQFEEEHPYIDLAAQIGGGAIPSLLTLGYGAPATALSVADKAQKLSKLAKVAKAGSRIAKAGAVGGSLGAGTGYLNEEGWGADALAGAGRGAFMGTLGGLVGGAGGEVLGKAVPAAARGIGKLATAFGVPEAAAATKAGLTKLATKIANMLPSAPPGQQPALRRAQAAVAARLRSMGLEPDVGFQMPEVFNRGAFGKEGKASETIARYGAMDELQPGRVGPVEGVPFMAIDEAAPGGNLEALAQDVILGQGGGRKLGQKLTARAEQANPMLSQQIEEMTGVGPGQAGAQLRRVHQTKQAVMDEVYDEARALTEGNPVTSKTFEEITTKTQAGRMARAMAEAQRSNRPDRPPLPKVKKVVPLDAKEMPPPPEGFDPTEWAADWARKNESRTIEVEVPDAELVHLTKMNLAKLAKLGERDIQGGVIAADAQAASRLFHNVRQELGDEFAHADEVAALQNQIANAAQAGQRILKTPEMATGRTLKGAISRDLETALGPRAPEAAEEFQIGAANALQNQLRSRAGQGTNPAKLFTEGPERQRQVAAAFRSKSDAEKFQAAAQEWKRIAKRTTELTKGSQTAGRSIIRQQRADEAASALSQLLHLKPFSAAKTLLKQASDKEQQVLYDKIGEILSRSEAGTLSQVQAQALIRQAVMEQLTNTAGRVGGAAGVGMVPQRARE